MMADTTKEIYNKFSEFPLFAYNCISYLVNDPDSELLWKILYYNDPDCWKPNAAHPNLTKAQKGALIYSGQSDETQYRVFIDAGIDEPWTIQAAILRVSPLNIFPNKHIIGNVAMAFECYSHFKINTLSNYTTRTDTLTQLIISALNGQEIGGIGRLYFDHSANPSCRTTTIGIVPFKGKASILCNWSN